MGRRPRHGLAANIPEMAFGLDSLDPKSSRLEGPSLLEVSGGINRILTCVPH